MKGNFYVNIVVQVKAEDIVEAVEKANDVITYSEMDSPVNDHTVKLIQFNVQPENKEKK